jgi:hypothetical protein
MCVGLRLRLATYVYAVTLVYVQQRGVDTVHLPIGYVDTPLEIWAPFCYSTGQVRS